MVRLLWRCRPFVYIVTILLMMVFGHTPNQWVTCSQIIVLNKVSRPPALTCQLTKIKGYLTPNLVKILIIYPINGRLSRCYWISSHCPTNVCKGLLMFVWKRWFLTKKKNYMFHKISLVRYKKDCSLFRILYTFVI